MRVQIILKSGYGTATGEFYPCGMVTELADALAVKLIRHRMAKAVAEPKAPEAAVVTPRERAVKPKPRARKG